VLTFGVLRLLLRLSPGCIKYIGATALDKLPLHGVKILATPLVSQT
jgi:hypothetical protein